MYAEFLIDRDLGIRHMIQRRDRSVETVGDIREKQRMFLIAESGEGIVQHIV